MPEILENKLVIKGMGKRGRGEVKHMCVRGDQKLGQQEVATSTCRAQIYTFRNETWNLAPPDVIVTGLAGKQTWQVLV